MPIRDFNISYAGRMYEYEKEVKSEFDKLMKTMWYDSYKDKNNYVSAYREIQEGDRIVITNGEISLDRVVVSIQDGNVYWEDKNDEFSFAPINMFKESKEDNKFYLIVEK